MIASAIAGVVVAWLLWAARQAARRADEAHRHLLDLAIEAARDDRAISDNLDI